MKHTFRRAGLTVALASLLTTFGCGGGSKPSTQSTGLVGTVAAGAAFENASVQIADRQGKNACSNAAGSQPAITADIGGHFQCTLIGTAIAPFSIVAIDPAALRPPLVSVLTSQPAAGSTSTVNVSPLTTAIAAMLAPNNDPFSITPQTGDTPAQSVERTQILAKVAQGLSAQTRTLVAQLAPTLLELGLDPKSFDPFSTSFVATNTAGATGDLADQLLDVLKVDFSLGVPTIATTFTDAVSMAAVGTMNPPTISTGGLVGTFSASDLDIFRSRLQACFALPASSRTPNGTETATVGGVSRTVIAMPLAPECQGIVVDDAPAAMTGGMSFLNHGRPASVWFLDFMTAPSLDGASFSVIDALRVFPQPNGQDIAVAKIRWVDKAGRPGSMILPATKFPGSRSSGSQWWLTGNQRPVFAYVYPFQNRTLQVADTSQPGFNGFRISQYTSGLLLFVENDRDHINTVGLTAARISGPGLPVSGVVMSNPAPNIARNGMSFLRKNGNVSNITFSDAGDLFRLQGTAGLNGPSAHALAPFAGAGTDYTNNAGTFEYLAFAHPSDMGMPPNANYVFDVAKVPAWSIYTFELFYNNSTTPTYTFTNRTVAAVPAATAASSQQWQNLHANTLELLNPTNSSTSGTLTSLTVAWENNPLAERVSSAAAYAYGPSGSQDAQSGPIPKDTTSVVLPTTTGYPLSALTANGSSGRSIQLRYFRTDGTYKDSFAYYN